jgi:hypothetical protein
MESQQKISSVLLASNVGTLIPSQNKIKFLFLNSVPTSILVVIKNSSYETSSIFTQLIVRLMK